MVSDEDVLDQIKSEIDFQVVITDKESCTVVCVKSGYPKEWIEDAFYKQNGGVFGWYVRGRDPCGQADGFEHITLIKESIQ